MVSEVRDSVSKRAAQDFDMERFKAKRCGSQNYIGMIFQIGLQLTNNWMMMTMMWTSVGLERVPERI
jgi:hypothetical protein